VSERYERVEVTCREEWRDWLLEHHSSSPGIWLVTYKRPDPRHVAYDAVVEEALCFGWVDSMPRRVDTERSRLLITPRKPGSKWSRPNKQRVERLERAGAVHASGAAVIAAARADGSWSALDEVEALVEPDDLRRALDADPAARRNWDGFPRSVKRGILEWILDARRRETRERRIGEAAERAAENVRANQWRQRRRP
jgi:uncharacterized protein YdeI (YjbR/CyaY-like superfamily)